MICTGMADWQFWHTAFWWLAYWLHTFGAAAVLPAAGWTDGLLVEVLVLILWQAGAESCWQGSFSDWRCWL
jgi:hypothetical protein